MPPPHTPVAGTALKIFDPRDPMLPSPGAELSDSSVVHWNGRWTLFLTGQPAGFGPTDIFSATLVPGAPLSASGWIPARTAAGELSPLSPRRHSTAWDAKGGRHCPSYVRGWDPASQKWVDRIYYAGSSENLWGPYTIGFLEWDGEAWVDQPAPAFLPQEPWEYGSVFEPNLVYHEGKWKMWYVAGSHHANYLIHCYAESEDGRTGWTRAIFAPPEMKMFDFCVCPRAGGFDAIFARIWVAGGTPPPHTGLWWCRSSAPSPTLAGWSEPVQLMTAQDCGWHSAPWKPSFAFDQQNPGRATVFFNGLYHTGDPGPFPFAFTLGAFPLDFSAAAT